MSKGRIPALPDGYADWLSQLKGDITQARQREVLAVNADLVQLFHPTGIEIQQQETKAWGAKFIERLALDLKGAFPEIRGFSSRNLKHMAFFSLHCPGSMS